MPALISILTEWHIREFSEGRLSPGQRRQVLEVIRQDERAREYYRRLISQAGIRVPCKGK
jgi:hypothetical protein